VLTGCKREPSPTVFVDPALATLVPTDTVFLAGVRMQQLQETPFYQKYMSEGKLAPLEEFEKETGLDAGKDLWEIVLANDGRTSVLLLRGKFSEMGMEPRLKREGIERFSHKGVTLMGDEQAAVAFVSPTIAVAG